MYRYLLTKPYTDCVESFRRRDERALLDLQFALNELATEPFGNPRLQTHRMHRAEGKTFISYVGNRGHRLIWRLVNRTIVLLLFGEHDPVERQGERLRLEIDLDEDVVRVLDADPATREPVRYEQRRQIEGTLFMAWNDAELAAFGFEEHEVGVLRRLEQEVDLVALQERMRPAAFEIAYNLVAHGTPDGMPREVERRTRAVGAPQQSLVGNVVAEGPAEFDLDHLATAEDELLEGKLTSPKSRREFAPVTSDALAKILDKPIEDWMIYLHPDQVRLTERPFAGPARVRGAAGTGKTVVALHRVRHLTNTYGHRVLFTTFIRTLPPVLEELYRRLSPSTVDRVEFVNLHAWAWRFLAQRGERPNTDTGAIRSAYAAAWKGVVTPGSVIDERGYTRGYYQEEIDWVIKGRGIAALDDYLRLARTGRGTGLGEAHRRQVWALYEEYQRQLARQGAQDFNDVLLRALEVVNDSGFTSPYAAVVVDEAQDLTEAGVRLAHGLAGGDKRDGLFLVGDGQQSVYPGGFSLASVGVDVVGRSAVLRTNYRNTRQVLEAASRMVADRPYDDLDEQPAASGRRDVEVVRDGVEPVFTGFGDVDEHDTALVAAIDDAAQQPSVGPGDLAVLVPTNRLVEHYARAINELGYRTVKLERYDGKPSDHVKVGTYQRGKGLEFKQVFLPRLDSASLGDRRRRDEDEAAYVERLDLLRRRLFVAMTRARDTLWCAWVGSPSGLLRRP